MRRTINIPFSNNSYGQSTALTLPEITNSIVILGANGSGKTRFGSYIEENNRDTHRITAQKSLMMPDVVNTTSLIVAEYSFLYGYYDPNQTSDWLQTTGKRSHRYQNNPNTYLTNDFYPLMTLLFSDEFETSIEFKENSKNGTPPNIDTKLDKVISIWQELLPHRKLRKRSGAIEVASVNSFSNTIYNGSQMSDGERVIFYLIAEAVCIKQESILIIDEPELHIHKSIMKNLFDKIEKTRPDVLFVYLTHDIDFAVSRVGAYKLWLKSFHGVNFWEYQQIQQDSNIPEEIYLEILGSRKPVLFVEGQRTSIDYLLYSVLFPNYTVTPVGGCEEVIDATKTFNGLNYFHHLVAKGIVDRDRRTDDEIRRLQDRKVEVLQLAEIENLFLIEEVVKAVANHMHKDAEAVFQHVKSKVLAAFSQDLEAQVIERTIHRVKKTINQATNNRVDDWTSLESVLSDAFKIDTYRSIYADVKLELENLSTQGSYLEILRVANIKRLLERSEFAAQCGLINNGDMIRDFIISILKSQSPSSQVIRQFMKSYVSGNW
ncbi:DUF4435 domain-containing protein [Fibrisoma montanum]|uniref:DUF4435 domain-containing protein n=1 Tax=Fibrisoma montanum TaxID=2305895 RepID=A0A418MAT2_9BACT|nr:DUF4435 domain-containing protein [Fibrisoma montanum]RIV23481.1 DUF4435 domain-containing protein [Fibrisoma montanum]